MTAAINGHSNLEVFRLLVSAAREGRGAALVTIVGVTGSSARSVGTHMAVVDDGRSAGSFSGGCVEAAVIAEAQRAIARGETRTVRFGAGSPFVDIRLPCGGGMDLLIQPNLPMEIVQIVAAHLLERRPLTLELAESEPRLTLMAQGSEPRRGFRVRHSPRLRLLIFGHGEESLALVRLALAFGAEVEMCSPDQVVASQARALGAAVTKVDTAAPVHIRADRWTAVVLLFHDHDWEPPLLEKALASRAFFIGAMGSAATHAARLGHLRERGVAEAELGRIHGPIGLIPTARDPSMLALSTLAHVAAEYRLVIA